MPPPPDEQIILHLLLFLLPLLLLLTLLGRLLYLFLVLLSFRLWILLCLSIIATSPSCVVVESTLPAFSSVFNTIGYVVFAVTSSSHGAETVPPPESEKRRNEGQTITIGIFSWFCHLYWFRYLISSWVVDLFAMFWFILCRFVVVACRKDAFSTNLAWSDNIARLKCLPGWVFIFVDAYLILLVCFRYAYCLGWQLWACTKRCF